MGAQVMRSHAAPSQTTCRQGRREYIRGGDGLVPEDGEEEDGERHSK
jgi:hypothetical protein